MREGDSSGQSRSVHTLTFLFADLRNYTAFVEQHGDRAASSLIREFREIVRRELAQSGGAEVKTEGDSFYVVFHSARQALNCGIQILRGGDAYSRRYPNRPLKIGIGLHVGEPIPQDGQYVGSAVNLAARLAQAADGGELLVSEVVRALIPSSDGPPMRERGGLRLKGIDESVHAYSVVWQRLDAELVSMRDLALAPMSYADAERLLGAFRDEPSLGREERLLRGRCLRMVESYHLAWNELMSFREQESDQLLRARAAIDLIYIGYYIARRDEIAGLAADAERALTGHPLLMAELHLASSVVHTGADRIAEAFQTVRFAEDALRVVAPSRSKELLTAALQRQLAHLYAHAASYRDALRAAQAAARAAKATGDEREIYWATYARGFAEWLAGRLEAARTDLERSERGLRGSNASLWRWILFCLATIETELGAVERGQRLAQQSGYGTPEGLAFLALRRGDVAVADEIIGARSEATLDPWARAVLGLIRCERGDDTVGIRLLTEAAVAFRSHGLLHWALSAQIHAAFWQDRARPGAGVDAGRRALEEIGAAGGEGFAWYEPRTARWLGGLGATSPSTRAVAEAIAARVERVESGRRPAAAGTN